MKTRIKFQVAGLMMISLMFLFTQSLAQSDLRFSAGLGGGLSYGGLGVQGAVSPVQRVTIFTGLGYNLNELGYNVGAQYHFPSQKIVSAYVTAMYGYNVVLIVKALETESKTTYFGPSAGAGMQIAFQNKSFLSLELLMPFRPQAYQNAIDDLKVLGYEMKDPLPFGFGVGYHIRF